MDVWIYVFLIEKTIVTIGCQVGVTSLARLSRRGWGCSTRKAGYLRLSSLLLRVSLPALQEQVLGR